MRHMKNEIIISNISQFIIDLRNKNNLISEIKYQAKSWDTRSSNTDKTFMYYVFKKTLYHYVLFSLIF